MKSLEKNMNVAQTRKVLAIALISTGFILSACGGGSGSGSTSATTASSSTVNDSVTTSPAATVASVVARGPVTALAGVTVNGVRYEDRTATVRMNGKARSIDDLRLGMMVEIEAERNQATLVSTARSISASSFAEGRIEAIDRVLRKITVMGVQISVPVSTAFEGATDLSDPLLVVGDYVEVHGMTGGTAGATATRIEKKPAGAAGTEDLALTGTVSQLNTLNKTFVIAGTSIAYGSARVENVGAGLADGMTVRVEGISSGGNAIQASEINGTTFSTELRHGFSFENEGIMTNYDSASASFTLNGVVVIASNARMDGLLAENARVKVHGVIQGRKLIASKVERSERDSSGFGTGTSNDDAEVRITASIKLGNGSFQIGTITVRWDNNTRFDDVGPDTLRDGMILEVRAIRSGDGYLATRIKRD
jgi:hypothetical protein